MPAQQVGAFNLDHYVDLRGLVIREGIAQQFDRHRGSAIIELRGGAGWGKTSAALLHAAERRRSGTRVVLFETEERVRICPASDETDVLYIVDECTLAPGVTEELLSLVQEDSRVQIIVCARERHPLIRQALSQGLVSRQLDLAGDRLTARDVLAIGRMRGVHLDAQRAEYVAYATGGWPIVATGFIELYADSTRDLSVAALDQLVARSFEAVLNDLVGEAGLRLLAKASLLARIRRGPETHALAALIERVRQLGLGEWVTA